MIARGDDPFMFPGLIYTASVEESKALNDKPGPMVIISASGMCEGGRILHHLKNNVGDPGSIVLIVGFQAENTLGRRIVDRVTPLHIFGEEYALRASVFTINALSAHADQQGLLDFYKSLGGRIDHALCVHGELAYCEANAAQLRTLGVPKVDIPAAGQRFENV
jgi:metallo-beta-lactamase family protein